MNKQDWYQCTFNIHEMVFVSLLMGSQNGMGCRKPWMKIELSAQPQIRLKINNPQTGHHPTAFAPLPGIWFVAFVKT